MSDIIFNNLLVKLTTYKKKYYTNLLLKGIIFFTALTLSVYIFFNFLEYFGNFAPTLRFVLLSAFVVASVFAFFKWLLNPALKLTNVYKQISDEEAAREIGKYFPEVNDRLLNVLQLKNLGRSQSDLVEASIIQKTKTLAVVPFANAINYNENKKYSKYLLIPVAIVLGVLLFVPNLFFESTARIINYDKRYAVHAPFNFVLENKSLSAFKNEDFKVSLSIKGKALPENAYIVVNSKRTKMARESSDKFSYTFRNLQESENFNFEAAGFNSETHNIEVIHRPSLEDFTAVLTYPHYLGRKEESIKNVGNLIVPEGTKISWNFRTDNTNSLEITFDDKKQVLLNNNNHFNYSKLLRRSENYGIQLKNKVAENEGDIKYFIDVIPDKFPSITVEEYQDSSTYNSIFLAGSLGDDYGLTKLRLFYKVVKESKEAGPYISVPIHINNKISNQNYQFIWPIDSLSLKPGESLVYFVEVWDNDGVNGAKSSKTKTLEFKLPSITEIEKELGETSEKNEKSINTLLSKAAELQKNIEKVDDKLRNKNELNWQDKKSIEDLLKQHNDLKKDINKLVDENQKFNEKSEKFKETDPELAYKLEQLQKLMNELLDDETKKLYEELQKLLEQNSKKEDMEKVLDQLQKKDQTLEKELERTLEMFKELKFEQKLEDAMQQLEETAKQQKELSDKSQEKKENNEALAKEQEKLESQFKEVKEKLKELSDINKTLEDKKELSEEELNKAEEDIKQDQQKSNEQLKEGQNKKAAQSQKNASKKMGEMKEKLSQMKSGMEMQQMQENLDDLRAILENLITLSFEQEALMKDFRKVNQTDPRFVALSQKQLKLKDESKVIEDSLLSLAKRVFQIESFVTREVSQMKEYMDESTQYLKERRPEIATGKQQFAMTSMNNLALLLNDVLKQMQQQMANAMKGSGDKMCNKPGGKPGEKPGNKPGLGDMQKELNERIQSLKQGGKTGRAFSEELAKLAAQQEMIRNALQQLDKKGKQPGGKEGGDALDQLSKEMLETEKNLVNKQLSQQTINRQQEILTRLLEAEKASKERDLDNKREATSAQEHKNIFPSSFEKYLADKEKEVDLLKTISPQFTPYFKQEVNEYFQKIEK